MRVVDKSARDVLDDDGRCDGEGKNGIRSFMGFLRLGGPDSAPVPVMISKADDNNDSPSSSSQSSSSVLKLRERSEESDCDGNDQLLRRMCDVDTVCAAIERLDPSQRALLSAKVFAARYEGIPVGVGARYESADLDDALKRERDSLFWRRRKLVDQIEQLKEGFQRAIAAEKRMTADMETFRESTLQAFRSGIASTDKMGKEIDRLREKRTEMEIKESQEIKRIDELSRMNAAYEECVKDLDAQHAAHQTRYTQLKKLVDEKKARTSRLREKLQEESRKEDDIAASLRTCCSNRACLESDTAHAQDAIDRLKQKAASLRIEAEVLTSEVEREEMRAAAVEKKLREATTKRAILNAELWQTIQDLKAHETAVGRFVAASTKHIVSETLVCA